MRVHWRFFRVKCNYDFPYTATTIDFTARLCKRYKMSSKGQSRETSFRVVRQCRGTFGNLKSDSNSCGSWESSLKFSDLAKRSFPWGGGGWFIGGIRSPTRSDLTWGHFQSVGKRDSCMAVTNILDTVGFSLFEAPWVSSHKLGPACRYCQWMAPRTREST